MALLEVRVHLLSGRQCAFELPTSASIYDVNTLVKTHLGVRRNSQHLIVAGSEVHARDPLSLFEQTGLLNVTLVVAARPCQWCGDVRGPVKSCSNCRSAFYCCVGCQRRDWRRHKPWCIAASRRTRAGGIEHKTGLESSIVGQRLSRIETVEASA